ncbi:MAG: manganese transporter [Planctomycetota bacterium]|nr:MAG: manganese transporter [Planctomycetota bacterium]
MKRHAPLAASLLVAVLAAAGCSTAANPIQRAGGSADVFTGEYPIDVVCTIGQVAEMARRIGGQHVRVEALMGPGVDPHLYSPVASDARKLKEADVILYNGLHLEGRMADLFVQMARTKATFAVTEGLQQRRDKRLREPPEFEGLYDPHVWHDPALWADCVSDVAAILAKFDSPHAADYQANAAAYRAELAELDKYCRDELAKIPPDRRVLVTAHDAFGYFGAAYGVEVHGLKGISTEEEKDLVHQERIQRMLIERKIPAVFVESAVAPRTVASLVEPCRAAGLDLKIGGELYADAMGPADSDAADYAGMIRHNVRTIVAALQ